MSQVEQPLKALAVELPTQLLQLQLLHCLLGCCVERQRWELESDLQVPNPGVWHKRTWQAHGDLVTSCWKVAKHAHHSGLVVVSICTPDRRQSTAEDGCLRYLQWHQLSHHHLRPSKLHNTSLPKGDRRSSHAMLQSAIDMSRCHIFAIYDCMSFACYHCAVHQWPIQQSLSRYWQYYLKKCAVP